MNYKGKIIWFYGLPSAGKTTLADLLAEKLRAKNPISAEFGSYDYLRVQRLDGDIVRTNLTKDLGFSKEDRMTNIERVSFVADLLSQNDICVICSFVTPLKKMRKYLREKFGKRLILIFVDTPKEVCIERDVKGLYKLALKGYIKDFTGVQSPFEIDNDYNCAVFTTEASPQEVANTMLDAMDDKVGWIKSISDGRRS